MTAPSHHMTVISQEPIQLETTRTSCTQSLCICGFYIHGFKQPQTENIWKHIASVSQTYSHFLFIISSVMHDSNYLHRTYYVSDSIKILKIKAKWRKGLGYMQIQCILYMEPGYWVDFSM